HDDQELTKLVHEELRDLLGMQAAPEFSQVMRYNDAMPQYHVGHLARVEQIERLSSQHPGLSLAGNAYRGVGIPDSIASGYTAAEDVFTTDGRRDHG
ncbi:MAG: FAD-dependent oxidoreductase, partial [Planctomycetaceae bacterium]